MTTYFSKEQDADIDKGGEFDEEQTLKTQRWEISTIESIVKCIQYSEYY